MDYAPGIKYDDNDNDITLVEPYPYDMFKGSNLFYGRYIQEKSFYMSVFILNL